MDKELTKMALADTKGWEETKKRTSNTPAQHLRTTTRSIPPSKYGDAQHLLIVVDRYGRRVRVQPALSRYRIPSGNNQTDAVVHWVDPRNRLQQFYSDPVNEAFTIAGFYYFKSRVLVYALSHYAVRFYDLRLHTTKNFITPYLELLADADLQLVLPHRLRLYGQGFTSDSDESLSVDVRHADIAPVSLPLKNLIYSSYSGFRPITGERAVDTHIQFIRWHYIRKAAGNFHLFDNHHNWSAGMWMLDISNKRWVNPLHAHRRMSYPHAVRRMKHHKFFDNGWARALPIVLANILLLLFGTVIFLRLVGYYNRENRRRKFGLDSSMSPGTL
ncbi:hypothetical protein Aduo_013276 [Ancylostoma duodenale]